MKSLHSTPPQGCMSERIWGNWLLLRLLKSVDNRYSFQLTKKFKRKNCRTRCLQRLWKALTDSWETKTTYTCLGLCTLTDLCTYKINGRKPNLSPLANLKALHKQERKAKAELKACLNRHIEPLSKDLGLIGSRSLRKSVIINWPLSSPSGEFSGRRTKNMYFLELIHKCYQTQTTTAGNNNDKKPWAGERIWCP